MIVSLNLTPRDLVGRGGTSVLSLSLFLSLSSVRLYPEFWYPCVHLHGVTFHGGYTGLRITA